MLKELKGTEIERKVEADGRAATVEWKQLHIVNMLTLWKPQFVFLGRFSASKRQAAAIAMTQI